MRLALAEESVLVDPFGRYLRNEVGEVVYDISEPGVMVAYTVEGDQVIFLAFTDLYAR